MNDQRSENAQFKTIYGAEIELELINRSNDSLQLTIHNKDYDRKQLKTLQKIGISSIFFLCLYQILSNYTFIVIFGIVQINFVIIFFNRVHSGMKIYLKSYF